MASVRERVCGAAALLKRHAIGIDISSDAVELTKQRLMNPQRTDSALLTSGRESYRNADQTALSLLAGLDFVPVQRNAGIDAFLRQDLEGTPVPIRIQRTHETIGEAAQKLFRASESKGARVMFLVVVARGGAFSFGDDLPEGVILIESPVVGIRDHLVALKAKSFVELTQ